MRRPVALSALALALAGCGATKHVTQTQTEIHTTTPTVTATKTLTRVVHQTMSATSSAVVARPGAAPAAGGGRSTLTVHDFSGNTGAVTIPELVDSAAQTDSFNQPDAGTRLVAVDLDLKDQGPGSIQDDANNDVTIIGSDGQDYTPTFASADGCTNFRRPALPSGVERRRSLTEAR